MKRQHTVDKELILRLKERIRSTRKERGITQKQLQQRTGIHIGRLENDNYVMNIGVSTLKVVCDAMSISLQTFFKWF